MYVGTSANPMRGRPLAALSCAALVMVQSRPTASGEGYERSVDSIPYQRLAAAEQTPAYWTAERIRSARLMPMPKVGRTTGGPRRGEHQ